MRSVAGLPPRPPVPLGVESGLEARIRQIKALKWPGLGNTAEPEMVDVEMIGLREDALALVARLRR